MIKEVTFYAAYCDICGAHYINEYSGFAAMSDESAMNQDVSDDETWYSGYKDGTHYCPDCFTYDAEGEVIIKY